MAHPCSYAWGNRAPPEVTVPRRAKFPPGNPGPHQHSCREAQNLLSPVTKSPQFPFVLWKILYHWYLLSLLHFLTFICFAAWLQQGTQLSLPRPYIYTTVSCLQYISCLPSFPLCLHDHDGIYCILYLYGYKAISRDTSFLDYILQLRCCGACLVWAFSCCAWGGFCN